MKLLKVRRATQVIFYYKKFLCGVLKFKRGQGPPTLTTYVRYVARFTLCEYVVVVKLIMIKWYLIMINE